MSEEISESGASVDIHVYRAGVLGSLHGFSEDALEEVYGRADTGRILIVGSGTAKPREGFTPCIEEPCLELMLHGLASLAQVGRFRPTALAAIGCMVSVAEFFATGHLAVRSQR